MITRGIIIGKIVDDLASLKYQIETRNKLGQFDLTKYCEDFLRELLNTTYSLNLQNLNKTRSNVPGLDLGDKKSKSAYQITSQKTSPKINETLKKITEEQKLEYDLINVFIIGQKQGSYTIDKKLCKKHSFNEATNIQDIDSLLRDIVLLDIQKLEIIYSLFQREFRQVKIELEPIDEKGNFESSYYNAIEIKASSLPKNGVKFIGDTSESGYNISKKELNELYEKLASVPRVTREILSIITDRGKMGNDYYNDGKIKIFPEALEKFLNISNREMLIEINILENADLVYLDEDEIGNRPVYFLCIREELLNNLFYWMKEQNLSIRTLLNTMDFTILDN
ncbi:SMEK domain-containing protein [Flavobacterium sp. LB1P62]|uniref:SMEK domain-containing protein n=1 Tax=Flavobacterium sp. LB1P62 TaxID=3401715 RepID=UPI003AAE674F